MELGQGMRRRKERGKAQRRRRSLAMSVSAKRQSEALPDDSFSHSSRRFMMLCQPEASHDVPGTTKFRMIKPATAGLEMSTSAAEVNGQRQIVCSEGWSPFSKVF